jgi:heme A synthase
MGMKNILIRTGDEALARVCEDRWKLLLISQIGLAASMLLALVPFPLVMTVAIAFAIFAFIAMILFLLLINHAYRSIDGKEQY